LPIDNVLLILKEKARQMASSLCDLILPLVELANAKLSRIRCV